MAIDITIDGEARRDADSYIVTEESTPLDPSDTTGAVGQITFSITEDGDSKTRRDKTVVLSDGTQGTTSGIIRSASGGLGLATFTADSRLAALVVKRSAAPYVGTLDGLVRYYLALAGITDGIVVDPAIADTPVTVIGWDGIVWDQIKKACVAYQVEVSLVSNNVVVRPPRLRIAERARDSTLAWAQDSSNLAQSIEVFYYQSLQHTGALAYPLGGWNDKVQVYQFEAGESRDILVPLLPDDEVGVGASITSVQQPVCVAWVDRYHDSSSVYSVQGTGEGSTLPIEPTEWAAGGGSVVVKINPDSTSLTVTVTASSETRYAPYRLAMTAGPSDSYSSLRIVGDGVFFDKQKVTLQTGVTPDRASRELGVSVDDIFINTYADAMAAGARALGRFSSAHQTITVTTTSINRVGDNGSYRYPTMGDFNLEYAGMTMGQFNALNAGKTMAQFNADQLATVQDDFDNQAFGNIAGVRVFDDGQWYRIRTVPTNTPANVQYTAEQDTVMGDFNETYAGMTMGQFNALWAGKTMGEFNAAPLRSA